MNEHLKAELRDVKFLIPMDGADLYAEKDGKTFFIWGDTEYWEAIEEELPEDCKEVDCPFFQKNHPYVKEIDWV